MEIIGVVAEYNPFHNGHLYHLNKIKELYPQSLIIVVVNGYFMQRGEISVLTKADKTKIALDYGADLVLELPFVFGSQSADNFAYYSIKILNNMRITKLVFGSECNDVQLLKKIADEQLNNPQYQENVSRYLKEGINYPTALAKALNNSADLNAPNDLLGISYIKAISKVNPQIEAVTIARTNDYHDLTSNEKIISASNIRKKITEKEAVSKYLPAYSQALIIDGNYENLFTYLKYRILSDDISQYLTVDEGIENRIKQQLAKVNNFPDLIKAIKTKRYTYNKISRMLIHILIGFTKSDHHNCALTYTKVLGFNQQGQKYLNAIKKAILINLKVDKNSPQYQYEIRASQIYDLIQGTNTLAFELSNKPLKKD